MLTCVNNEYYHGWKILDLHTDKLAYWQIFILTYMHTDILAFLHTDIFTYRHTCILTYLHPNILTFQITLFSCTYSHAYRLKYILAYAAHWQTHMYILSYLQTDILTGMLRYWHGYNWLTPILKFLFIYSIFQNDSDVLYTSWGVLKLLTSIPRVFCHFSEFFIHTFSYSCNKIQCCRVKARSWTWFWYVFYNAGFIFTLIPAPEKKKWGQNLKDGTLRFGRIFARKCLSWF